MSFFEYNSLPPADLINDTIDSEGGKLLHKMCRNSSTTPEDIRRAVAAGADINAVNDANQPPIALAIKHQCPELFQEFLKLKAKTVFKTPDGKPFNAIYLATSLNRVEYLNVLLSNDSACLGLNQTGIDSDGYSNGSFPLHLSAQRSGPLMCRMLLDAGALIDLASDNDNKELALHAAIQQKNNRVVKLLLQRGADFEKPTRKSQKRAIHIAAEFANKDATEELIKHGASINAVTASKKTALHYIAASNNYLNDGVAKILLAADANINARDEALKTPMMYAAKAANRTILGLLIERGADTLLTDKFNQTALQFAKNSGAHYATRNAVTEDVKKAQDKAISALRHKGYQKYKNARKNNKNGRTP